MFMVLSSWQSHCESSPGSFDECIMAPSGRRPKTKPDDLGCESACIGCQKLHPPSPFSSSSSSNYKRKLPRHRLEVERVRSEVRAKSQFKKAPALCVGYDQHLTGSWIR